MNSIPEWFQLVEEDNNGLLITEKASRNSNKMLDTVIPLVALAVGSVLFLEGFGKVIFS